MEGGLEAFDWQPAMARIEIRSNAIGSARERGWSVMKICTLGQWRHFTCRLFHVVSKGFSQQMLANSSWIRDFDFANSGFAGVLTNPGVNVVRAMDDFEATLFPLAELFHGDPVDQGYIL